MDAPVEAEHAVVALDASALHHDVVAGFTVVVGVVPLPNKHIMADDGAIEKQLRVFPRNAVKTFAALDPVIAFVAHKPIGAGAAENEVIILPPEDLRRILAGHDVVIPLVAKEDVKAAGRADDVVALVAAQQIVAKRVFNDVVARAAKHVVGFGARIEVIVAAVTPQGVDAPVGPDFVVTFCAAHHHVFAAREAQRAAYVMGYASIRIDGRRGTCVVTGDFERCQQRMRLTWREQRVDARAGAVVVLLRNASVELQEVVRRNKQESVQVRGINVTQLSVAHHKV